MSKDLEIEVEELQNLALIEIEEILQSNKKSLKDYPSIPFLRNVLQLYLGNRYIYAEQNYDKAQLQHDFQTCFASLTG